MSLLIKALHKAEQEKTSEAKSGAPATAASLELAPMEPDLQAEAGFSDDEPVQRPVRNADNGKAKQQAAGVVFAAKADNRTDSTKLLIAGGVLLLVLAAGGFYFYLESLKQPELVMPARVVEVTPTPAPVEAQPVEEAVAADATAAGEFVQEAVTEEPITEAIPPPVDQGFSLAAAATAPAGGKTAPQVAAPQPQPAVMPPAQSAPPREVKVKINNPPPAINPDLAAGYRAFQAGDDAAAQAAYRKVLQADVRSVDALLGMAAIAMRQERNNDAMGWYGKVLEIEPRNSYAQAAMADLLARVDPVSSESRIKNLIAVQPEAAHLYAALGSIYAERNDWPQAQQAYFEAHRLDASNPEHAFNLAVSLDQLGKAALALQYYRQTLSLLGNRSTAAIDRAALESRIAQLQ